MNRIFRTLLLTGIAFICTPAFAGPVNVNTADAQTISDELTGVGLSRAQAIIDYREENGPFESVDELLDVKGIGERTLEMNRDNILLESSRASGK